MSAKSLGSPLAIGNTAEVYARGRAQVLKLFHARYSQATVEHEAQIARTVHAAGLPVPAVGPVVEVNGRHGIVFERVDGPTLLERLAAAPWRLCGYARLLARLQADVHKIRGVAGVPDQRVRLSRRIGEAEIVPAGLRAAALRVLTDLPVDDRLCHGDFHPGNVLMTKNGPMIIDWNDATNGHPLSDVARSTLLIGGAPAPDNAPGWVAKDRLRRRFLSAYRRHYCRLCPGATTDIDRWRVVNAAARLSESVPEGPALLAYVRAQLRG
jgi:uncharacterized protein (TIGR02172 family)